ncbi:hypothetical protein YC2023_061784 [Brassica napus]
MDNTIKKKKFSQQSPQYQQDVVTGVAKFQKVNGVLYSRKMLLWKVLNFYKEHIFRISDLVWLYSINILTYHHGKKLGILQLSDVIIISSVKDSIGDGEADDLVHVSDLTKRP